MNRALMAIIALLAAVAAAQYFAGRGLENSLAQEKAAHAATRQERDNWEAQALAARAGAEALAENARACLAREAKAQADAAERTTIMAQVKPRTRTEAEQTRVVDDETRSRVIERLNRGL